jgi:hypothetical protein
MGGNRLKKECYARNRGVWNGKLILSFFLRGEPGERSRYSDYCTGWTIRVSNPGIGKRSSSFTERPYVLTGPFSLVFSGYRP